MTDTTVDSKETKSRTVFAVSLLSCTMEKNSRLFKSAVSRCTKVFMDEQKALICAVKETASELFFYNRDPTLINWLAKVDEKEEDQKKDVDFQTYIASSLATWKLLRACFSIYDEWNTSVSNGECLSVEKSNQFTALWEKLDESIIPKQEWETVLDNLSELAARYHFAISVQETTLV
jgi:hypothetical protein